MPLVIHPRIRKGLLRTAAVAAVSLFAAPGIAQAACQEEATTQVFSSFGDRADYFLAPNGGLESGSTGWTLSGASVVAGNESYYLNAATDTKSLRIAPGGKAVTSEICIDSTRTGYRFLARQANSASSSSLKVTIRYTGADGVTREQAIDALRGSSFGSWTPSRVWPAQWAHMWFKSIGLKPNDTMSVRFVFQVDSSAGQAWQIDDLYIDPWRGS
jgi:hypothetical protein